MENKNANGLTPYLIEITETYVKQVVVYGKDEYSAVDLAEELCSDDTISLDANFADRSTECIRSARPIDISCHEVYGKPEEAPIIESSHKTSLADQIQSAASRVAASEVAANGRANDKGPEI